MTQKFHFISGLPRSGSTLLSALLLQNPRFHAGMTSPVGTLLSGMLQQFGAGREFGAASRGRDEVVVRQIHEGADQRGAHAEARALGQAEAVVKFFERLPDRKRDHAAHYCG